MMIISMKVLEADLILELPLEDCLHLFRGQLSFYLRCHHYQYYNHHEVLIYEMILQVFWKSGGAAHDGKLLPGRSYKSFIFFVSV